VGAESGNPKREYSPEDDTIPALLSYVRQRKCALFVGAGLSRPAGYPGWGELMRLVVGETGRLARMSTTELEALLEAGKFADVADQCRELLGRTWFSKVLRRHLAQDRQPPEATHRAIVQTPYACIVTTNFDTLLEDAYGLWSEVGVPKAPTGVGLGRQGTLLLDGAFFVLKAHGTIHDDASMVFTTEDYRRFIHQNAAFTAMMSAILLSHAILFVGYSLSDPNFRLLLDSQLTTFGAQAPPRYAIMEAVGEHEREILRRTAGIEVISYKKGEHGTVARILRTIADKASPPAASLPPRVVLRTNEPLPALRVSIRPHGPRLDLSWFETTTHDLAGAGVRLERKHTADGSLSWMDLAFAVSTAGQNWRRYQHVVDAGATLRDALGPLITHLTELKPETVVVFDPAPELWAVPWEWATVNGKPLALQAPVFRMSPALDDASRGRPFVRSPARALLVGATTSPYVTLDLPGVRSEIEQIANTLGTVWRNNLTPLIGEDATYERVLHEIASGAYDVVHFAGHSWHGADGTMLSVHDGIIRSTELMALLIRNPPALLFLNSHYTGAVLAFTEAFPVELPLDSSFDDVYRRMRRRRPGLEHTVARAGVGSFIGCSGSPTDDAAAGFAVGFYSQLCEGVPVAQALHRARAALDVDDDATPMHYVGAGYPELRFPPR
jgi:hypothetical protein